MKLQSSEDIKAYTNAVLAGAGKGAAVGFVTSVGVYSLIRHKPLYKAAGGYHRAFVWAVPALFFGATAAETASRHYEEEERLRMLSEAGGVSVSELKQAAELEAPRRTFTQWCADRKYLLITAGWAASMVGSFWLVNRDKYMTKSQKIVQARVYAQGLTVALLLASVLLSVSSTPQQKHDAIVARAAESWKHSLEELEEIEGKH